MNFAEVSIKNEITRHVIIQRARLSVAEAGMQENGYMALIDLVVEKIVKIPLESTDKPDVIRELVKVLKDAGEIDDYDAALKAVQDREDKQSTGLTDGIAIPHAKTAAVKSLKLAIGISPEGIDFDSMDKQPSKLFFLLLASPGMSGPHVEALAEIARLSRSKALCKALVNAENANEVVKLLAGD
jgi:fructose-specific phosphotransferase system IIA component